MTAPTETEAIAMPDAKRMIGALTAVAVVSGVLLVFVYQATLPRITENKRRAIERAVFEVLPGTVTRETFFITDDAIAVFHEGDTAGTKIYAGYDEQGKLVGVALEAAAQGYQDIVRTIYGYSPDKGQITGMTVVESKETPGLGDRIGKDEAFKSNFVALDATLNENQTALLHVIETVRSGKKESPWQIDGISGATISSEAVGRMINESAQKYLPIIVANRDALEASQ